MHVRTGFYDTSNRTEPLAPSLAEIGAFELSRDGMLVRANQCEPRKAGGDVGDRCRDSTVHQTQLLLVFGAEFDLGFYMSWLDEREHAADVLHELLALEVAQDGLAEVGVLGSEFHATKIVCWVLGTGYWVLGTANMFWSNSS